MPVTARNHPIRARMALLMVVIVCLAAACSDASSEPTTTTAGGGSTTSAGDDGPDDTGGDTGAVPTAEFTMGIQSDPQSLDPALATDLPGSLTMVNLYESLVRFEGSPPELQMHLAESITPNEAGDVYTATLRSDITFHDGSPVDAAAVAYSFDRLIALAGGRAAPLLGLLDVGSTEVVDESTVQFNLNEPSGIFPSMLAFAFIVNPAVIEANAVDGEHGEHGDYGQEYLQGADAGSGPYQLVNRVPNSEMQMTAYEDYWQGWSEDQFGTFDVQIAAEPASAGLLVQQGVVDAIYENYPDSVFDELEAADGVTVHTDFGLKPFYLFLNNQRPPTDDVRVRQAIAYAFDYEQAMEIAPGSVRLPGPIPEGLEYAMDEVPYETDLDRARELLDEAGVEEGEITLEFGSLGGPSSLQTRMALLLQDNLAELGIGLEISNHAWADILTQTSSAETTKHVYAIQLSPAYPDADAVLSPAWHSSSHGSWSGAQWYTGDVDAAIEEARSELDPEARGELYDQILGTIVEDSPAVFMVNLPVEVAMSDRIGGYSFEVQYYNYQVYDLHETQ